MSEANDGSAALTDEVLAAVSGASGARADRLSHGMTKPLHAHVSKQLSTKVPKLRGRSVGGRSPGYNYDLHGPVMEHQYYLGRRVGGGS